MEEEETEEEMDLCEWVGEGAEWMKGGVGVGDDVWRVRRGEGWPGMATEGIGLES